MKKRWLTAMMMTLLVTLALAVPAEATDSTGGGSCTHSYGAWSKQDDVNHKQTCSGCGETRVMPHSWNGGKYTAEPTCKDPGQITHTCTVCGGTSTSTVAKLTTHTYDNSCDTDCNVCGAVRTGGHTSNGVWYTRSSSHYHVCLVCGKETSSEKHHPGPAATEEKPQICLICGYEMMPVKSHTHTITQGIQMNEAGHWEMCDTCGEKVNGGNHVYDDDCDESCDVCGFVNEYAHSYGDTFQTDDFSHWVACTLCGKAQNKQAHIASSGTGAGEAQICAICGAEMAAAENHTHEAGTDWYINENSHWHECACGEQMEKGAHTWDAGMANPDGSTVYLCTACGAETVQTPTEPGKEPEPEGGNLPWVIIGIAAVAAACGSAALAVLILAGKNKGGKFSR